MKKAFVFSCIITTLLLTSCATSDHAEPTLTTPEITVEIPETEITTAVTTTTITTNATTSNQSEVESSKRDGLSNDDFYEKIKNSASQINENTADNGTYTLIAVEENGTINILFKTKENQVSALKALQVISYAPSLLEECEKHDTYKHVYFDWADYDGNVYATWDLSRVGEKLIQDSELKWYDKDIEFEYDKIMDGDYSAVKDAEKNN